MKIHLFVAAIAAATSAPAVAQASAPADMHAKHSARHAQPVHQHGTQAGQHQGHRMMGNDMNNCPCCEEMSAMHKQDNEESRAHSHGRH
jgi:hypothetical protein